MSSKHTIGITIGDFNGVGPELVLRVLSNPLIFNYCTPVVYGTKYILNTYARLLDKEEPEVNIVKKASQIKDGVINIRTCSKERITIEPGVPSLESGKLAFDALELAVSDIKSGLISDLLTAPIDKKTTVEAGLAFNGHTQYLADKFESDVQMILLNDELRVAMVTGHTPFQEVSSKLSVDKIAASIKALSSHLQSDFGIIKPKIAVLGLNPHSGDNGLIGNEEIELIKPAIEQVQKEGAIVIGPYPPDGFFGSENVKEFDGVLGMYHDQVLIPFKQNAFYDGVNYTAGLPFIRTSPDHGTAFDIAGKGIADTASFVNALYLIKKVYRNRMQYYNTANNPLPFKEHRREKFSIGVPDLK
jgi:4-hydroxythreonine-4-phosphate dehydrogenase